MSVAIRTARVAAALLATAALTLGPLAAPAAASGPADPLFEQPPPGTANFTGKWAMPKHITRLLTSDGHEPPLNEKGQAEYAKRRAALKAGDHSIDPISRCWMHGVPRLLYAPYPFLILQTTRSVDFVHEVNHTFRIIYWDKTLPEDPDPLWLGSSIARLDGNTLIVDTIGFNDMTWLDRAGNYHSGSMKVTERLTLENENTIRYSATIDDPEVFSRPWTISMPLYRRLEPNAEVLEFKCVPFVEELLYKDLEQSH